MVRASLTTTLLGFAALLGCSLSSACGLSEVEAGDAAADRSVSDAPGRSAAEVSSPDASSVPEGPMDVAGDAASVDSQADARSGNDGSAVANATGHKRGIAYGYNSNADLSALSPGISWWYNWSPSPDSTLSSGYYTQVGVEFVPMIWGGSFDVSKLSTEVPTDAKYLLTFNEPNFGSQSNLTPQAAAALWPQVEAFAKSRGLMIVSPAVNYCGGSCNETDPYVWLADFFTACPGCQVDYIAVHWYACYQSALTSYVEKFETQFGKQLWLTEFSCLDGSLPATAANEQTYMSQAVAALEADPMIFRYSWFTGRDTGSPAVNLLGAASGSLTPLGQGYVTASPAK